MSALKPPAAARLGTPSATLPVGLSTADSTGKRAPVPHRVRELTGRRTETTTSYLLSDGTVQLVASGVPTHYQTGGEWRDVDTDVAPGTGAVSFANHTNVFATSFGSSTDHLVTVSDGGASVALGAFGAPRDVTPTASGSQVSFDGVFGTAGLRYRVEPGAVKEEIVLPDAAAAASVPDGGYAFTLDIHGLTARAMGGGQIGLYSTGAGSGSSQRLAYVLPAPFMTDANGARSDAVTQQLSVEHGDTVVRVVPDHDWLTAPGRAWPTVIDPTVVAAPDPSAAQDASIYSGTPDAANGSSATVPVGRDATGAYRGLFRFDTSMIPSGTTIRAAQLRLHMSRPFAGDGSVVPMTAYQVTSPWDENTVTWNSINTAYDPTVADNEFVTDDTDLANVQVGAWKDVANTAAVGGSEAKLNSGTTADTFEWNTRVPWPASYNVEVHYVPAAGQGSPTYVTTGDAGSTGSVAVNQTTGDTAGQWTKIATGVHSGPNKVARVTMTHAAGTTATSPVADAVRWDEPATATKQAYDSDTWHTYGVGSIVQHWIDDPTSNDGFMVKANDETTTGPVGGPRYEASEADYGTGAPNRPELVIVYGNPGPVLHAPTKIHADGADLTWDPYLDPSTGSDDDLVEYQIYRGCLTLPGGACTNPAPAYYTTAQPAGLDLVGTVPADTTSFTDTTATASDGTGPAIYRYWVVARTASDAQGGGPGTGASNSLDVTMPRQGREVDVFTGHAVGDPPGGIADTTLSSLKPTSNLPTPDSTTPNHRFWLQVGNSHATYGDERAVMEFDTSTIKPTVKVTDAHLDLWESGGSGSGAVFDLHALSRDFDEGTATWQQANATTPWTTPGGDYDTTVLDSLSTGNTAARLTYASTALTAQVQGWVANSGNNHGFLLKAHDETASQQWIGLDNSEATDDTPGQAPFVPALYVEHLVDDATQTIVANQVPERFVPGTITTTPVTVTNTTNADWPANLQLSYRWTEPGSPVDITVSGDRNYVPLGRALAPGESVKLDLPIRTPINSDTGTKRLAYDLYLDLWDPSGNNGAGAWWSATHAYTAATVQPPASGCGMVAVGLDCVNRYVEDPTSTDLGLEKYGSYAGEETGAGSQALVNLHAGNLVWSYDAISNPSLGPATFLRLAYNSMDLTDVGTGFGVSVQPATLTRLGSPIAFPPTNSLDSHEVAFIDGDGTSHVYKPDDKTDTPNLFEYDRPAGVQLDLTHDSSQDADHEWVFTRADGTRFYYSETTGLPTSTVDANGNTLAYHYDTSRRLTSLTDAAGRTTLTLGYDSPTSTSVAWIRDISGRALKFGYNASHQLVTLQDGPGFTVDPTTGTGAYTDPSVVKSFSFAYTTSSTNGNALLTSVTDPRGHASTIGYWGKEVTDSSFLGWVKAFTDRRGNATTYDYADGAPATTSLCPELTPDEKQVCANVTDLNGPVGSASAAVTTYKMDGYGRTIMIKDANANAAGAGDDPEDTTTIGWDRDHNVTRLEEPNGAVSTWRYNDQGLPVAIHDAVDNHDNGLNNPDTGIRLHYHQETGTGTNPAHPWVLDSKTSAAGRTYQFTYDPDGNLLTVRDANGHGPTYTYNPDGTLAAAAQDVTTPGKVTSYASYDATGQPRTVTDPLGHETDLVYDDRGNTIQVTDALGNVTTAEYDGYGRPTATTTPGAGVAGPSGTPVTRTTRTSYDLNDNTLTTTAPNGAVTTYAYNAADLPTATTLPDNTDTPTGTARTVTDSYDPLGRLAEETAPVGNTTTSDPDDYVTRYTYDPLGQTTQVDVPFADTDGTKKTATWTYDYDKVGNQTQVVDPKKNASTASDYTTRTSYDLDHRPIAVTDASGATSRTEYDADGLTTASIDALGVRTKYVYDGAAQLIETHVPHTPTGATSARDQVTSYAYDAVGNVTRTTRPTGFYSETVYDADNRPIQTKSAFKAGDTNYANPASTFYTYDKIGELTGQSLPTYNTTAPADNTATGGQWTTYSYYPSGDIETSTDPFNLKSSYTYNELGEQTSRTYTPSGTTEAIAGDTSMRTQSWDYYPDGSLKAKSDTAESQTIDQIDNPNPWQVDTTGTWTIVNGGTNTIGTNYWTHAAAAAGTTAASDSVTWQFTPDQSDTFDVYASCPVRTDASTAAPYTVNDATGAHKVTINQKACTASTPWVKLGTFTYNGGVTKGTTLNPATSGVVSADAMKFVPTSSGDAAPPTRSYDYTYDANGQTTTVHDHTPATAGATADTYTTSYDGLGRPATVQEALGSTVKATTSYTYDLNSNTTSVDATRPADPSDPTSHAASRYTGYTWDVRNLLDTVKTGPTQAAVDGGAGSTWAYTYDARGMRSTVTKPNGNITRYTYYEDGLVHTANERTSLSNGNQPVALHTLDYNPDGDKTLDLSRLDQAGSTGTIDQKAVYSYTPGQRLASATYTGADPAKNETYVYDAAGNTTCQTIGSTTTHMQYDRNRLTYTGTGSCTATQDTQYRYDPYGRLAQVTGNNNAGNSIVLERYAWDGWDRQTRHQKYDPSGAGYLYAQTTNAYDPFDRTTTQTVTVPNKTTINKRFTYLGVSDQVAVEEHKDANGTWQVAKTFAYGPSGEKLQLTDTPVDGLTTPGTPKTYDYGTNPHGDVETLTNQDGTSPGTSTGQTADTYRYTAYGDTDTKGTTGGDAPSTSTDLPTKAAADANPVNPYRFSSKRFEPATGTYDMGFRDYDPGINHYLAKDLYNGALSDMALGTDPWATNRYMLTGGNPINLTELDGHHAVDMAGNEVTTSATTTCNCSDGGNEAEVTAEEASDSTGTGSTSTSASTTLHFSGGGRTSLGASITLGSSFLPTDVEGALGGGFAGGFMDEETYDYLQSLPVDPEAAKDPIDEMPTELREDLEDSLKQDLTNLDIPGEATEDLIAGERQTAEETVSDPAARRVTLRIGTKAKILGAQRAPDGKLYDPNTGVEIPEGKGHFGHRPGFEWWRTQRIAREEGWTRQQVIEYENIPSHYWYEDPYSNMSHQYEMPR